MKTWKERADAAETAQETLELLRQMRDDDTASPEDCHYVLKIQAEFLGFSPFIEEDEAAIN
jgi:hypothetical protein